MPFQAAPPPQAAVTPAPQCTSPLYYDGLTLTGCVTLSGGPDVPVCWSTDEGWLECPASNISQAIIQSDPRTTVDGQSCLLPYVVRVCPASSAGMLSLLTCSLNTAECLHAEAC